MKALWLPLVVCTFLLSTVAAYGQSNRDLVGTWHDELKSTLVLNDVSPAGRITGTYNTTSAKLNQTLAVVGWVSPDTSAVKKAHIIPVIFMVWWNVHGSITVWSGYLSRGDNGKLSITTIWNFVHEDADPDALLDQTKANVTVFKPGPAK